MSHLNTHLHNKMSGGRNNVDQCAPGVNNGGLGCLPTESLRRTLKAYSERYPGTPVKGINQMDRRTLWSQLNKLLADCNGDEICWMKRTRVINDNELQYFKPEKPDGKYEWLSTDDIYNVMEQYEKSHPEFSFMGPVPINFSELSDTLTNEVNNLDLQQAYRSGIRKIGIVFNESPWYPGQQNSGSHWVAMWIDLDKEKIAFFDSYGCYMKPGTTRTHCVPSNINKLINRFKRQYPGFKVTHNIHRHQKKDSECGMYCMAFILEALNGKDVEQIFKEKKDDDLMNSLRNHLFRKPV